MNNCTMNTYEMKRDIVNFSEKICKSSDKPTSKFVLDMIYGIFKSKDILLSSIAGALDENIKKAYTIDRLSNNLATDLDTTIDKNFCNLVFDSFGDKPVFLVDDSDVVKPKGKKFEYLGTVTDGSTDERKFENGYFHTEIVGLTKQQQQPISLFSKVHSSVSKDFLSTNNILFEGIDKVVDLLNERNLKGIFVNDRGYDSNKVFQHYFEKNQHFVIRLKESRKVFCRNRWHKITTIRDSHKGKIKLNIGFQDKNLECFVSVFKVQITALKKWINLIIIYGLSDTPMMLSSNIPIKGKEDVTQIIRYYFSRWRIEEYFKFKKQEYGFENFRVRSFKAINNLNMLLTYTIGLIGLLSEKMNKKQFVNKIIKASNSLRSKVFMWFYQIARGIFNILKMARTGIKDWQNINKTIPFDGQLSFL